MGSNEAGEQRAGNEETLPAFPDGLIHPRADVHKHMQVRTHSGAVTAQRCTITLACIRTAETQTDILMQITALSVKLQPHQVLCAAVSVLWVVDEEGIQRWNGNLLYCLCRSSYVNASLPLASFYSTT